MEDLPAEILVEIMLHMPHSTLYLFQQTCSAFRQLSRHPKLKEFNLEFRDGPESYCIGEANHRQRQIIRDILIRGTQCEHCYSRRDTGVLQKEMERLYRPFYCSGCKENHPTLFFSPGERRKKPHEYTQCLGRVGNFTLCSHKSLPAPDLKFCNCAPSTGTAHLVLEVRYDWTFTSFLSPAWLFNLDFYKDQDCSARLKRNPLYDERTKHILWCDSPGCETGSEQRWMNMAKVYLKWNVVEDSEEFKWCHRSPNDAIASTVAELPTGFWDVHWLSFTYDFFHSVDEDE
ncbi:hypothetical protein ACHAP7_008273 [Fusarium lateritium]